MNHLWYIFINSLFVLPGLFWHGSSSWLIPLVQHAPGNPIKTLQLGEPGIKPAVWSEQNDKHGVSSDYVSTYPSAGQCSPGPCQYQWIFIYSKQNHGLWGTQTISHRYQVYSYVLLTTYRTVIVYSSTSSLLTLQSEARFTHMRLPFQCSVVLFTGSGANFYLKSHLNGTQMHTGPFLKPHRSCPPTCVNWLHWKPIQFTCYANWMRLKMHPIHIYVN